MRRVTFTQPSDKQLYLQSKSCHTSNTKTGLAYGFGLRIRRICEKDDDYYRHRQELKGQLRKRGYAGKFVESQLQRVDGMRRETLLKPNSKLVKPKRVPLVMNFSKLLPDVRDILRKHSNVLYRSDRMKKVFDELPILAYRSVKNLCDTLVHVKTAKFTRSDSEKSRCSCGVCRASYEGDILGKQANKPYQNQLVLNGMWCMLRSVNPARRRYMLERRKDQLRSGLVSI